MTFYVEFDEGIENDFPFDTEKLVEEVASAVLDAEGCPYECCINVLVTDNEGIRIYNRDYRKIDKETDVLSFPNLDYNRPSDFHIPAEREVDYFDPESGELVLGDIILSKDRIYEQAASYGHSIKREFAFLVAHSMLHLCGYDHMEPDEAAVMEGKQEEILKKLEITRE